MISAPHLAEHPVSEHRDDSTVGLVRWRQARGVRRLGVGETTESVARVVDTTHGVVRGWRDGNTVVWKGIPYAAPPVGSLRFRAPQPRTAWEGVWDCGSFGPIAPQGRTAGVPMAADAVADEDCLNLNVWASADRGDYLKPVMVWIHGGAYCYGASSQPIYDGRHLVETGDIVLVTLNYRVGVLGFLDLSSFSTDEHIFDTNCGLRDQVAALEWVRENIAAFGGDPDEVTLFGESSGAGSITTLMTCPSAEGLFHRAIAQSPPATSAYGAHRAASVAGSFLDLLELKQADIAKLRELPVELLVEAGDSLIDEVPTRIPGTLAMAPVVDRQFLPRYPVAAFQKGHSHRIPLIIGTNRDEASVFKLTKSNILPVTSEAVGAMMNALAADHPELPPQRMAEILSAYPDHSKPKGALAVSRDAAFRMPALWVADAHSRHSPTWMYRFDQATPVLRMANIGAGHATELPYVFGNFGTLEVDPTFWLGGRRAALDVAGRVQRRWLAFAHHSVPAALDGSTHWRSYNAANRSTLLIDRLDSMVSDPDHDLRIVWGDEVMGFN